MANPTSSPIDAQAIEPQAHEVLLFDPVGSPILCTVLGSHFVPRSSQGASCHLTLQVSPQIYQKIDAGMLFNLNPELRRSLSQKGSQIQLRSDLDIVIEVSLQPDLCRQLERDLQDSNANDFLLLLSRLSQERLRGNLNPLVETESWLGLTVTQPQDSQPRGYRTLWKDINLSELNPDHLEEACVSDRLLETLSEFAWEQAGQGSNDLPPEWMAGLQQQISALVKQVMTEPETKPQGFQTAKTQAKTRKSRRKTALEPSIEITPDMSQWLQQFIAHAAAPPEPSQSLLETVTQFLQADGWDFTTIEGESVVRSLFQGNHGQWTCYLWCMAESDRLAIYSVCPMNVPPEQRQRMAEFLTRCNYCLLMGNFEMDFTDGEIRFKTSLDASGSHLTFVWLKQLLYANVLTMDQYLPGIMAVLSSQVSPADALAGLDAT
jgi:hypothetical protein